MSDNFAFSLSPMPQPDVMVILDCYSSFYATKINLHNMKFLKELSSRFHFHMPLSVLHVVLMWCGGLVKFGLSHHFASIQV